MSARPVVRPEVSTSGPARCPVIEAAHGALQNSPYWAIRRVRCHFHEGQLTLHGQVPTFYLLQVAQELVCRLPGVEAVENRIVVQPDTAAPAPPPVAEPPTASPPAKLPRRVRVGLPNLVVRSA